MNVYCCTGHESQNFSIYTVTSTVEENMHKDNDIWPEGGRAIGEALKDSFMFESFTYLKNATKEVKYTHTL